jgi:anti-anti-sigma factor
LSTSQDFAIDTAGDHGDLSLNVRGDLDMSTAPALAAALTKAGSDDAVITLDLSGVTFIDSSALVVLVSSGRELAERGARLRIGPRSEVVAKVLEITQLDQQADAFEVLPDPT